MSLADFKPYVSPNGCVMPLKCLYARMINGFYVPCGKCEFCRQSKAREWAFRLEQESLESYTYNVLLTYDDKHLPYHLGQPSVSKVDVQLFLKRFREQVRKRFGTKLRFFLAAEYGGLYHRPHYHMILFSDVEFCKQAADPYRLIQQLLDNSWGKGMTDIEPLRTAAGSVKYLTTYMTSMSDGIKYDSFNKPFLQMSRCGLGKSWINRKPNLVKKMVTEQDYNILSCPLPRYLRRKIMPDEQQIARADAYFDYCKNFENNFNKLNYDERNKFNSKLYEERINQKRREQDAYRKGKVHLNNSNTSQLSCRAQAAKERKATT